MLSAVFSQLILKTCYFLELKKKVPKKGPLADSSNDYIIPEEKNRAS